MGWASILGTILIFPLSIHQVNVGMANGHALSLSAHVTTQSLCRLDAVSYEATLDVEITLTNRSDQSLQVYYPGRPTGVIIGKDEDRLKQGDFEVNATYDYFPTGPGSKVISLPGGAFTKWSDQVGIFFVNDSAYASGGFILPGRHLVQLPYAIRIGGGQQTDISDLMSPSIPIELSVHNQISYCK